LSAVLRSSAWQFVSYTPPYDAKFDAAFAIPALQENLNTCSNLKRMERIVVKSPADGSVVGEVAVTPTEAIEAMVARAHQAYLHWREVPLHQRVEPLRRLKRLILQERGAIAELVAREQGKPRIEAMIVELFPPLDVSAFLMYDGVRLLQPRRVRSKNPFFSDRRSTYYFHPYGVWAVIAPWNYPFTIPMTQLMALTLAGNAALLKPSPLTPHIGAKVMELFERAGFPEGLVQVVQGGAPQGSALLANPTVRGVIFTGSVPVGRLVAEQAAKTNKKVILELGGKDPALVLADADLQHAAQGIAWASMVNAGQTCASVERVYVEQRVYEPFLEALRAELAKIRLGHPLHAETDMGPVVARFQLERVQRHIEDACARGGRVLLGGRVRARLGRAVPRADAHRRRDRRDARHAGGDLRTAGDGAARRQRGGSRAQGERERVRADRLDLDARPAHGATARADAGVRLGERQLAHRRLRRQLRRMGWVQRLRRRAHARRVRTVRTGAAPVCERGLHGQA
jgi:acyl-CoA reductase-like NAD-dependent aldehyde dehydrogenase